MTYPTEDYWAGKAEAEKQASLAGSFTPVPPVLLLSLVAVYAILSST